MNAVEIISRGSVSLATNVVFTVLSDYVLVEGSYPMMLANLVGVGAGNGPIHRQGLVAPASGCRWSLTRKPNDLFDFTIVHSGNVTLTVTWMILGVVSP